MKLVAALFAVALLAGCGPGPKIQVPTPVFEQSLRVKYMNDGEGTYIKRICWNGLMFMEGKSLMQVMQPDGKPMTCED